ncbi:MAG: aldo/keto reductase [Rhizobiales bacterium]|nr:aldo/keto reductase [Hyphomicrobiales bacterium]NRB15332.1 aldo/keto reductase [Hyphomicrobiales bacterium]
MKAADKVLLNQRTISPINVSRMGFGGAPLGNMDEVIAETDAQATLQAAFDAGIRYFDTAPHYGLGTSESRFGKAIERFGRSNICLSTKVGKVLHDCQPDEVTPMGFLNVPQKRLEYDYTHDGIMRSYHASLKRLKVDKIDILLVHDVDALSQGSQQKSDEKIRQLFDRGGYKALVELRDAGEISAIGAGVNTWQACQTLLEMADFDTFLCAGRYTLLEQDALDTFLPMCIKHDVGIILGGPYNSGILASGATADAVYNYAPAPKSIKQKVNKIAAICQAHNTPLIAAALQFPLGHGAVKTIIPGAKNTAQVAANINLLESSIPTGLWADLKSAGLMNVDAPTPNF